jgi:hypothetical protein
MEDLFLKLVVRIKRKKKRNAGRKNKLFGERETQRVRRGKKKEKKRKEKKRG